jgi:hypothetical protein
MEVRNLKLDDVVPDELKLGFENAPQTAYEWIWVVERDGKIVAMLVTAPAHLVVILLRIKATREAEGLDVRALMIHAFRAFKTRGYKGYLTWLDPTKAPENAFIGIIRAMEGTQLLDPQVACCGKL